MLLSDVQAMDAMVLHAQTGTRFSLFLIAAFTGIAAIFAGVGLYGVVVLAKTIPLARNGYARSTSLE